MVLLRDVVELRTGTRNPTVAPDEPFTYVDVAAIDNEEKAIVGARVLVGAEAPSRARKLIREGDVLVSTVRPNLNAVAVVPPALDGQVASTGFCVLRARQSVLPEFLYFYTRSKLFVDGLCKLVAGAMYPAVTDSQVLERAIPLPSLEEQHHIVDLLARAEGIVRLRRKAQQKAAELIPAIFIDMFGDPATNPRGWSMRRMADICTLVRGSSPRPQGDPQFFGGPVPRLMIADITRDGVYVTPSIDSLTLEGAKKSRPMAAGDVVMAVSGAVGLPAILAVDACIHDGFVGFRTLNNAITSEYLYSFLNAYRRHSVSQAVGATFQNLKTDQIKDWLVPLPPLAAQHQFQQTASELRGLNRHQSHATTMAVTTFQSLLHRTFQAG
jgi:type I restriction enzyme S subunit